MSTVNATLAGTGAREVPDEPAKYPRQVVLLTMLGVMLVMLLASLDQTIVGTAMPKIIAELQGLDRLTWVTTAYLLTSTVMVPIYGKLSDLFGRKTIMIVALILFLIGSATAGAAQTMNQLIAFRGFQGLGAGGLMSMAIAVVGDLFTPRERAKWQGVIMSVFSLAFILGPTAGGYITDNASWRWVFYVNLPLGMIALFVLIFLMPNIHQPTKDAKIDFIGAGLLIAGVVPLLLGFSLADVTYPWASWPIVTLFTVAIVGIAAFIAFELRLERRGEKPIVSPSLFQNRIFTVSVLITMLAGMAMMGSIAFIPLFLQGVVGVSATNSGTLLIPLMLTAMAGSVVSGLLVSRFGKYKLIAVIGAAIAIIGSATMLLLNVNSSQRDVEVIMLVMGLGMGTSMSLYTLIVQNALPTRIGETSASLTFFRQIGSTIGLAAMGSVLNSSYTSGFRAAVPTSLKDSLPSSILDFFTKSPNVLLNAQTQAALRQQFGQSGPQGLATLNTLMEAVKTGLAGSLHNIFFFSLALSIISFVVVFFLKEIPLRGGTQSHAPLQTEIADAEPATDAKVALPVG